MALLAGCAGYKLVPHPMSWTAPRWYGVAKDGVCKLTVYVQHEDMTIDTLRYEIPEGNLWRGTHDEEELVFKCYPEIGGITPWQEETGPR